MIKTRLSIAFAALALLAITQGLFTFWATRSAAHHAQRSVVATQLLKHYLEFGANKQRLKVWFAQSAMAGDAAKQDKVDGSPECRPARLPFKNWLREMCP